MPNVSLFNETIKKLALDAVDSKRPVNILFGTVTKINPLEIKLDSQKVLPQAFLVLCRNVTDHEIQMEVNHQVEKMSGGAKDPSFTSHIHQYKGVKPFKVLNALKVGEKVVLLSMQGGQKYLVLDRV